jgi:hypothetical protein
VTPKLASTPLIKSTLENQFDGYSPYVRELEAYMSRWLQLTEHGYDAVAICHGGLGMPLLMRMYQESHHKWGVQKYCENMEYEADLKELPLRTDRICGPTFGSLENLHGVILRNMYGCMSLQTQNEYVRECFLQDMICLFDHSDTITASMSLGDGALLSMHYNKPWGCSQGAILIVPRRKTPQLRSFVESEDLYMSEFHAYFNMKWLHQWRELGDKELFRERLNQLKLLVMQYSEVFSRWNYEIHIPENKTC